MTRAHKPSYIFMRPSHFESKIDAKLAAKTLSRSETIQYVEGLHRRFGGVVNCWLRELT